MPERALFESGRSDAYAGVKAWKVPHHANPPDQARPTDDGGEGAKRDAALHQGDFVKPVILDGSDRCLFENPRLEGALRGKADEISEMVLGKCLGTQMVVLETLVKVLLPFDGPRLCLIRCREGWTQLVRLWKRVSFTPRGKIEREVDVGPIFRPQGVSLLASFPELGEQLRTHVFTPKNGRHHDIRTPHVVVPAQRCLQSDDVEVGKELGSCEG